MSLLKLLSGDRIERLARQLNVDPRMANDLTAMLAPALGSAAKKRAEAGGLAGLLGQLRGEGNARFIDEPETAASPEAREDGESFLETLLGSREASHDLAREAAARSGFDAKEVESFLPALAAMAKGGLQKETPDSEIDDVMGQLSSLMDDPAAGEAPAVDGAPERRGGGLMGAIANLAGGAKPAAADPARPSHVTLRGSKPSGVSIGGKPASVSFGMVPKPPAADRPEAAEPGDPAGGLSLGKIAAMLDEDGDGSPLDDILERLMK